MADRLIDSEIEIPELSEELEALLYDTIVEAQNFMAEDGIIPPFTSLVVGENLYLETYEGDTDSCYEQAEKTVRGATGVSMYTFCYDGYIEGEDEDDIDAVIVEMGTIDDVKVGYAFANTYAVKGDTLEFSEDVVFLSSCPNFLAHSASLRNALEAKAAEEEAAENAEAEAEEAPEE